MRAKSTVAYDSRRFKVNRTALTPNYVIETYDEEDLYFVKIDFHTLSLLKPCEKGLTVLAMSHIQSLSRAYRVGVADSNGIQWEDMTRIMFGWLGYRLGMTVFDGENYSRIYFLWRRTRSITTDGLRRWCRTSRNYELLNEKTGEVIAAFSSKRGYHTCGTLEIFRTYGKHFELMLFISYLTIYEAARRCSHRTWYISRT